MELIKDCNNCRFITITETEQRYLGSKNDHRCKITGDILSHQSRHPIIPPPSNCPFSSNETHMIDKK